MKEKLIKFFEKLLGKKFIDQVRIIIFVHQYNLMNYCRSLFLIGTFIFIMDSFSEFITFDPDIGFHHTDVEGRVTYIYGNLLIFFFIGCLSLLSAFCSSHHLFLSNYISKYFHIQKASRFFKPIVLMFISLLSSAVINFQLLNYLPTHLFLKIFVFYVPQATIFYLMTKIQWFEQTITVRKKPLIS